MDDLFAHIATGVFSFLTGGGLIKLHSYFKSSQREDLDYMNDWYRSAIEKEQSRSTALEKKIMELEKFLDEARQEWLEVYKENLHLKEICHAPRPKDGDDSDESSKLGDVQGI